MSERRAPFRVDACNGPWPLLGTKTSRQAEADALVGRAAGTLMQRAGLATAKLARALAPHADWFEVFCGPGNNGGDGLVAARELHASGTAVRAWLIGDPARLPADAAAALRQATAAGVAISTWNRDAWPEDGHRPMLTIDALLGLGATRAPEGSIAEAVGCIARRRAAGATALAVDLPTGLHADTGRRLGKDAVTADATLSLLSLKPGLFTADGRDLAGAIWFDDLGVASSSPDAWLAGPAAARTVPPHAAHKGALGDVVVVGGAPGMTGAAWLAARAALAAGAGRVYVAPLDDATMALDPGRPELMLRRQAWRDAGRHWHEATLVCGCGGGTAVDEPLRIALDEAARLVLDADALNLLAAQPPLAAQLRARAGRGLRTVITPHPLEAARLLGTTAAEVQADRLAAAMRLAQSLTVDVVLKGSGTVLAAPGAVPRINPTGNAALASAGSGDVLAGWIGGLWAQQPQALPLEIACAAVWRHGRAADVHGARGRHDALLAADLVEALRALD